MNVSIKKYSLHVLLTGFFLICTINIIPDVQTGHDSIVYIRLSDKISLNGFMGYTREPLYPLLISILTKFNIDYKQFLPVFQNLLFLCSLLFLLHTIFQRRLNWDKKYLVVIGVCLLPTYLIVMNGSIYTESISASLILLILCFTYYFFRSRTYKSVLFFFVLTALFLMLNFQKGTYIFVNILFSIFLLIYYCTAFIIFRNTRKRKLLQKKGMYAFLLVVISISAKYSVNYWINSQSGKPGFQENIYDMSGLVIYGRAEFAEKFDFRNETKLYLLNGISESLCEKIYSENCKKYNFARENDLGYFMRDRQGGSDIKLAQMASEKYLENPIRQIAFGFLELSKFIFHYTNTGFASVSLPGIKTVYHSKTMNIFLKIFNIILYIPIFLILHKSISKKNPGFCFCKMRLNRMNDAMILVIFYFFACILMYMATTTLSRMFYPSMTLIIVLNVYWYFIYGKKNK